MENVSDLKVLAGATGCLCKGHGLCALRMLWSMICKTRAVRKMLCVCCRRVLWYIVVKSLCESLCARSKDIYIHIFEIHIYIYMQINTKRNE